MTDKIIGRCIVEPDGSRTCTIPGCPICTTPIVEMPPPFYLITIGDGRCEEPEHYATATSETLRQTLKNAARDFASSRGVEVIKTWRESECEVRLEPSRPDGFAIDIDIPEGDRVELVPVFSLRPGDRVILDDGVEVAVRDTDTKGCTKSEMRVRFRGRPPIRVVNYFNPIMRRVRRAL